MSKIIADTYEILAEIGSGGGGVVYLGRHLNLDKLVVLKADKRSLLASPEALRREVDAMKNLSHTYIPQVYDFIMEDGVVYTVMDYVEGESLDKPLKRGEHFPLLSVLEWSCELLEALVYLHSCPPYGILHGDIKPANIILTPRGDIRLIDFNISLFLGEEGAIRIGHSQGYASPEHYGLQYGKSQNTTHKGVLASRADITELMSDTTILDESNISEYNNGKNKERPFIVFLDCRSDIYGVGATMYHLLTGMRPAIDAKDVMPIANFSRDLPANIGSIVSKAMQPNPDFRFQTASEMLMTLTDAYERLYKKGHKQGLPRTIASIKSHLMRSSLDNHVSRKHIKADVISRWQERFRKQFQD